MKESYRSMVSLSVFSSVSAPFLSLDRSGEIRIGKEDAVDRADRAGLYESGEGNIVRGNRTRDPSSRR